MDVARGLLADAREPDHSEAHEDSEKLIEQLTVEVIAYCPCGSKFSHRLSLMSTSECLRCTRTLAIRSIQYHRPHFGAMPTPQVSVGFVFTPETLRRRRTAGVH